MMVLLSFVFYQNYVVSVHGAVSLISLNAFFRFIFIPANECASLLREMPFFRLPTLSRWRARVVASLSSVQQSAPNRTKASLLHADIIDSNLSKNKYIKLLDWQ
jgi:hypothetical protein